MSSQFLEDCRSLVGPRNVLMAEDDLRRFEVDVWQQYSGKAAAVIRPGTTAEVASVVALAARHGITLVPQAGNTGLVNGGIPDASGSQVVISVERLDKIRAMDAAAGFLIVEAGCILDKVRSAAEEANRMFPLALGSGGSCRIGGNIATNAGGLNVLRYGMMRDLVLGIEVVLADGSVLDMLNPLRKDNTGYDLKQLFIGSEGTLGVVTAASLKLASRPKETVTVWLAVTAAEDVLTLFSRLGDRFGELISAFELLTADCVDNVLGGISGVQSPLSAPHPLHLLIEVAWTFESGLLAHVEAALEALLNEGLCADGAIAVSEAQRVNMWRLRESQSEAASKYGYVLRSDVSIPIRELPGLLGWTESTKARLSGSGVKVLSFGHVGDGNIHINFVLPPGSKTALRSELLSDLYALIDQLNGSISAEHGVGRAKREAVASRHSASRREIERRIKRAFDPHNLLNPGVILSADRIDLK
ncbi:FAD-binding oxidoreductase [Taklimakanibacter deserti]|uniref:FAD-binding oxidoreductase n=1 Tax=Taklimakanibacter deserti TaxID=2267839 RepID=UPI000E65CF41